MSRHSWRSRSANRRNKVRIGARGNQIRHAPMTPATAGASDTAEVEVIGLFEPPQPPTPPSEPVCR